MTEIEDIGPAGYQSGLPESKAIADGGLGEEYEGLRGRLAEILRNNRDTEFGVPELAGKLDEAPEKISEKLAEMAKKGEVLKEDERYRLP